jgi:drug/metabolite transporter (DMT)-like permease
VTVTTAFLCYVRATRIAEISFIQPIKYLALPYAFLLGFLIWGDLPDASGLAGAALIVASGLFILHRKRALEQS